jgi:hypothetical protein
MEVKFTPESSEKLPKITWLKDPRQESTSAMNQS